MFALLVPDSRIQIVLDQIPSLFVPWNTGLFGFNCIHFHLYVNNKVEIS